MSKIIKNAENVLKSVGIPPQPKVILDIKNEIDKANPNLLQIADLVSKDVGLAATTIKVANSPIVGFGKVKSILQALNLLGTKNFYNLILASALRDALSFEAVDNKFFEIFWDHSLQVAKASTFVAKRVDKRIVNDVYLAGLFHDCAIPVLFKRFHNYMQIAKDALGPDQKSVLVEEKQYNTNHCIVGYVLAKSWQLPSDIFDTIMWHHSSELKYLKEDNVKLLVRCLRFTELVLQKVIDDACKNEDTVREDFCFLKTTDENTQKSVTYTNEINDLIEILGLSQFAYEDISDEIKELLNI